MAKRVATLSNTRLVKTFGVAPRSHKVIIFGFQRFFGFKYVTKLSKRVFDFQKFSRNTFSLIASASRCLSAKKISSLREVCRVKSYALILVKSYKRTCFLIPLLSFSTASDTFPEVWNTFEEFELLSVLGLSSSRRLL